jgi:hypothetical protein
VDHPVEQVSGVSFVPKLGVLVCHRERRSMGRAETLATITEQVAACQLRNNRDELGTFRKGSEGVEKGAARLQKCEGMLSL